MAAAAVRWTPQLTLSYVHPLAVIRPASSMPRMGLCVGSYSLLHYRCFADDDNGDVRLASSLDFSLTFTDNYSMKKGP